MAGLSRRLWAGTSLKTAAKEAKIKAVKLFVSYPSSTWSTLHQAQPRQAHVNFTFPSFLVAYEKRFIIAWRNLMNSFFHLRNSLSYST